MAFPAAIVILPIGTLFILSGLIVNVIQALLFILVRPISRNCYRKINKVLIESLWLELIWLIDWWARIKIELYADSETFQLMGKESALLICNHKSDIDWLIGWVLAQRRGCLGSTVAIMKKEVKYLPVLGWSMWFSDYLFLERNWAKDEAALKSGFQQLNQIPVPFWLALFVEGTRFTHTKLLAAQEFAVSRGLPIPRNVLIPRTKGFVTAVKETQGTIPAIYDCTFAVPKSETSPTLLRMLKGISCSDAVLEKYNTTNIFSEQELQHIGCRPKRSFMWTSLLSTWQGILFTVLFLVLVTIIMEILIYSSESERSKSNMILPTQDPMKQKLLQT
ncbi:hypothetical protein TanjilG_29760 [Lupinus angustifolius]|uniref:Phospholipid/glycerol acyltransferase domain-containing protein n=1 Tax=Lupinus angustifolius TaxID=3871 RepID=A0A394DMR2_LUPAN|nr:hypothetical protein TanjilG_29760 [Lupinus angustifolius]